MEYELENMNDTIILFTSKNKESSIRCHYSINSINKSADYPYLQISLNNIPKGNETRDFKADIGIIFTLADSHKEEVEAINDS